MKHFKTFLCLVSLLGGLISQAQHVFIAQINPSTGVHTAIDSIPGIYGIAQNGSTFDKNHHRFIFIALDALGQNHLVCVNALTGALISSPAYTANIGELHYDNSSDKIYGLEHKNSINKTLLVSINLSTAGTTLIDTLPFYGFGSGTTFFSESTHNFYTQSGAVLYSMNVITGSLTSVPTSTAPFGSVCFDNVNGYAYGILSANPIKVVKINPSNGTYSVVGTYSFSGTTSSHKAFDEINRRYTLSSSNHLYSINVDTGNVVLSPSFPVGLSAQENIMELNYDNSNSAMYALFRGNTAVTTSVTRIMSPVNKFTMAPNPASKITEIRFDEDMEELNIRIINSLGQVVISEKNVHTNLVSIKLERLSKGVYFVQVSDDKKLLGTKKLVVE